jgi:hypothetical protein
MQQNRWTGAHLTAPPKEGQPRMAKNTRKKKKTKKAHGGVSLTASDAVFQNALMKTLRKPVLVTGVTACREVLIPVDQLGSLGIDERYQRLRITTQVNTLIHVLKAGGLIPNPIAVVRRDDESLWIVDGQQRFWAHFDTGTPLYAKVFTVNADVEDKLGAERRLFAALNNVVRQSPASMLKAYPGTVAEMLRTRNDTMTDPLYRRVQLETSERGGIISASALCTGLMHVCGLKGVGGLNDRVLPRLDTFFDDATLRLRMARYLDLAGMVFPISVFPKMPPSMPVRALGSYCFLQWHDRPPKLPTSASINRMRLIKWATICPSGATRFIPVAEHEFATRWKEAK